MNQGTIPPPVSAELLSDTAIQHKKIGPTFAGMRGDHLDELSPVEAVIREAAPLPISYDVSRNQPLHFDQFSYTELMGVGLLVSPMSIEASARLVQLALDRPDEGFDAASAILGQRGTLDKYKLDVSETPKAKAVAFLPGSNMLHDIVSKESLSRAMFEDDELVLKPHPMTTKEHVRELVELFGHHRVLLPNLSGHACLMTAERVYASTTTELGLYAVLMGKPIHNIGNFWLEGRGIYSAYYRLLWGKSPADAKAILSHVLNSPYAGFFHKDDPELEARAATFYAAAMDVRSSLKPLIAVPPPEPMPPRPSGPPPRPANPAG